MKKKLFILVIVFLGLGFSSFGQDFIKEEPPPATDKQKPEWKDRLIYGGNLWFSFGNVRSVDISPMIGYIVKPRLTVGTYLFYNYYESIDYNFSTDIYGFRPYAQFTLIKDINEIFNSQSSTETGIVLQGETEFMSLNKNLFASSPIFVPDANRILVNSILVGGGIRQTAGGKAGMYLLLMWNISNNLYYPYGNPIIRFGFNF